MLQDIGLFVRWLHTEGPAGIALVALVVTIDISPTDSGVEVALFVLEDDE